MAYIDQIIQAESAGYTDGWFGHRNIKDVYKQPQAYAKAYKEGEDKRKTRESVKRQI